MARKKTEVKPVITAAEPVTKPVRLDLPADVHRLLRLVAAHADQSMASYAREILAKTLREEAKRRGLK
jgi:plasmid stability protein